MHYHLTHLDDQGRARMVDVSHKSVSKRVAVAKGEIIMAAETLELIREQGFKKGDVLTIAEIAGVMGAKRTAELIPLCHPLPLDQVVVDLRLDSELPGVIITARAVTSAKTGVEMEALTAVSLAALTVYDMVKSAEKTMNISNIRLIEKRGGQSGDIKLNE